MCVSEYGLFLNNLFTMFLNSITNEILFYNEYFCFHLHFLNNLLLSDVNKFYFSVHTLLNTIFCNCFIAIMLYESNSSNSYLVSL